MSTGDWSRVASYHAGIVIAPYQWSLRLESMWYYGLGLCVRLHLGHLNHIGRVNHWQAIAWEHDVSKRWDEHFLGMALYHSRMSKDPSTRVGSVIVGPDREILSAGFNGFPRGIADTHERLHDRDTKLKLVVHAEMNALLAAARTGMRLKGCTLYLAATDDSGLVWGGPPCTRCTVEIIQVGISEIVSHPAKSVPSRWHEDLATARALISEAGISYREYVSQPFKEQRTF